MRRVSEDERALRGVPLCGRRVIERLRSIGITKLADLAGKDPVVLMNQVNLAVGKVIWRAPMAIIALSNLIAAAGKQENRTGTCNRASNDASLSVVNNLLRLPKKSGRGGNSKSQRRS
jgi:hypothetical protein